MMAEHIIVSNSKVTKEFVEEVKNDEVPLSFLRRKLGKYKVKKAFADMDLIAAQLSDALKSDVSQAVGEASAAFQELDTSLKESFLELFDEFKVLELTKKKRNGRVMDHVRLRRGVDVSNVGDSTVFKVKK